MKRNKKPLIDPERFVRNPLVGEDFKILVNRKRDGKTFYKDKDGDWLPREYDLERSRSTKVYIERDHRLIVSKLHAPAQRLYLWLMYELDPAKDYLWINKYRYMEENEITSLNTYKAGVEELARCLFICPSFVKDVYWVNPKLIFSGSRVNKYPDKISVIEDFSMEDSPVIKFKAKATG